MKIKEINEGSVIFDNGLIMESEHSQDCCEEVYVNFDYMKQYNMLGEYYNETIYDVEFEDDFYRRLELVEGMGFIMMADDYINSKIFVPCYNIQNGYYSDDLVLLFRKGEETIFKIDLRKYKHNIIA